MRASRCGEIFRGAVCPRCQKTFYICRHCDRGHVYCCKKCSQLSRFEKCQGYRKQYRQSEEARKDHSDRERERRREVVLGKKSVGDQSYGGGDFSAMVSARVRTAAVLAVLSRIGEKEISDEEIFCEFCGRPGRFVYFGDGTVRQRERAAVFRFRD